MNNQDKASLYDQYIRESDSLQLANSKLKSQFPINVPQEIEFKINENNEKIGVLVKKLEALFI